MHSTNTSETSNPTTTYVYNGVEVTLTGRQAKRMKSKSSASSRIKQENDDVLYEIEPINTHDGSWKLWVTETNLYQVID